MSWRAKLSSAVRELRIHYCQNAASSASAREFILRNYKDLKMLNPRLPILMRESSGVQPRLWVRGEYGKETSFALEGLTEPEIAAKLKSLVNGRQ